MINKQVYYISGSNLSEMEPVLVDFFGANDAYTLLAISDPSGVDLRRKGSFLILDESEIYQVEWAESNNFVSIYQEGIYILFELQ